MKKIFIGLSAVALACSSAFAGKTAEEIRIYLNPGHGSWGPNNRPCQTIGRAAYTGVDVDTTGFFESNTNLWKMYSTLDHLVEAGVPFDRTLNQTNDNPARVGAALDLSQHIVMSHVKVGPYPYVSKETDDEANAYNRPLSEIAQEVEANNFDIFLSVHSNAATEGSTTDYPLFLFRGQDDETYSVPGSKAFGQHLWPFLYGNQMHNWTYYSATNSNARGDISFYGTSSDFVNNGKTYKGRLGVLKHGVLGGLYEGYFHTYQPARQKYMNKDMCRLEGQLYARGIIDYMGWKKETTGDIYGFVRDLHEKFSDPLYSAIAKTDDQYKPINGAVVKLYKDGAEVASYTTDNEYNGIFAFTDLEPGTYTLSYSAEGYKAAFDEYLTPVTVTANNTSYVKTFLESESYVAPTINYENYMDPVEGNSAFNLAPEYNMTASAETSNLATLLEGKTVRRQIVRDGKMYVLALDASNEPSVYVENLTTGAVTTVSTAGTTLGKNRTVKLNDIALTAEGVLVGTSYGKNQYSADYVQSGDIRGYVAIYKWDNDNNGLPTGDGAIWFESTNSGNYLRAWTGQTIAYSGTLADGAVMITAETVGAAKSLRFVEFSISDAALVSTTFINKDVQATSNYTATKLGTDYQLIVSPHADNQYIIDGSTTTPLEWQTAGQNVDAPLIETMPADKIAANENGATCFKYAGRSLMVAPVMTDGKATGVKLYDITDGFANATLIATNGTTADAADANYVTAAGEVVTTLNDDDVITAANINLYLIRDAKVTKFTTAGTEQPKIRGQFAYNVRKQIEELQTTFYYTLADKAESAKLVVRDKDGNVVKEVAGAAAAGENSIVINNMDIANYPSPYSWTIDVTNTIPTAMKVFSDTEVGYAKGVIVDTKPGSPNFGTVYVSNPVAGTKVKGLWKYDQNFNATNLFSGETFTSTNKSSPFRLGMLNDGSVVAADWSDALAGLWLYNPADNTISQMFQGTKDSKGTYTDANGTAIGGGTTCASVVGTGADAKLLTFCEDYPTGNNGQTLVMYNIGNNHQIATAPDATFPTASGKLNLNTNVEIRARQNGFWASQSRTAGNNNSGVPSLIYCDYNDNILFNSGSDLKDLNGSNGAGFAVTEDNKYLATCNGNSNIEVYELTWNNNVPSFSKLYDLTVNKGVISEMAFDAANNLYVAAQTEFSVWALPGITGKASTFGDTFIFDPESGVEATVADSKLVVFPNPANDVVNVKNGAAIESIALYSMSGAQVNAQPVVEGSNATLNVSGLASGVYMLKVNDKAVRLIKK